MYGDKGNAQARLTHYVICDIPVQCYMGLAAPVESISGRRATRKVLLAANKYDSIGNSIGHVHVVIPAYPLEIAEWSI